MNVKPNKGAWTKWSDANHAAIESAEAVASCSADREKLREIAAKLQSWGESDETVNWARGFESLAASLREESEAIRQYLTKPNAHGETRGT